MRKGSDNYDKPTIVTNDQIQCEIYNCNKTSNRPSVVANDRNIMSKGSDNEYDKPTVVANDQIQCDINTAVKPTTTTTNTQVS